MGLSKDMWQPIETAPKDETLVLLYCPPDHIAVYAYYEWGGWKCTNAEYSPYPEPTHWMPLPEPPSDE